jgi:hypothetical protein
MPYILGIIPSLAAAGPFSALAFLGTDEFDKFDKIEGIQHNYLQRNI